MLGKKMNNWRKRFDKKFFVGTHKGREFFNNADDLESIEVKAFISKTLKQRDKEIEVEILAIINKTILETAIYYNKNSADIIGFRDEVFDKISEEYKSLLKGE